ncbi:MAG TPA: pyruvate formate lyase family protein [Syntrophorhabdaceae bacterium]|nr:pyruvate formate lyase family protein [Syntrophorhabdaceae bacterium]
MSTARIEKLRAGTQVEKFPICIEKVRLMTESYRQTDGEAEIIRRAKAGAHILDNITIFMQDGELIVGNGASKYMGVEMEFYYGPWPTSEIVALKGEGWSITDSDLSQVEEMNEYWKGKSMIARIGESLDDERLWPFMQTGIVLAPWKSKTEGSGGGYAESGMGIGPGFYLMCVDFEKVIGKGLLGIMREAEEELKNLRYFNPGSVEKGHFLNAVIISLKAIIRFAERYAALASQLAWKEKDPLRKKELETIAETCKWVPANPARSFREAIQALWFTMLMVSPSTTAAIGRMDRYLYPFYKKDVADGRITDEEVLEYLQCLRLKDMELNRISGAANRQKNAGMAKWHNCTIGGVDEQGKDTTNELTYLILEAARRCPTPHHTITLRVHEGTPEALMLKGIEVVKAGIGMPAFIGDKSYIAFLLGQGVPLQAARDYVMCGCLDVALPGNSRIGPYPMFIVSMVLEITLNNGVFAKTGEQLGPRTGDPETFKSFDELLKAFETQWKHFSGLNAEYNNLFTRANAELFPDPFRTVLTADAIKVGKSLLDRTYLLENLSVLNNVGTMNVADSLTAIRKLVFDDKKYTMRQMRDALKANWEGYEQLRKDCIAAPKYGNDNDYADEVPVELYRFLAEMAESFPTVVGGTHKASAISISSQWPGGAQTGATPEGRFAGACLADGAMSPVRGMDTCGPTAIFKSAAKINQDALQATLLNMKFHPTALKTEEDRKKLASLIKTYFQMGGKHVQFNVVSRETMEQAKKEPAQHKDLVVRVAGYSAYFVKLTPPMQDEIISRTEQQKT